MTRTATHPASWLPQCRQITSRGGPRNCDSSAKSASSDDGVPFGLGYVPDTAIVLRTAAELIDRHALVVDAAAPEAALRELRGRDDLREVDIVPTSGCSDVDLKRATLPTEGGIAAADLSATPSRDFFVVAPDQPAIIVIDRLRGSRSMLGVLLHPEMSLMGLVTKHSVLDTWSASNDISPR